MIKPAEGGSVAGGVGAWDVRDAGCRAPSSAYNQSPTAVHVGKKGIIDGFWTGELKCIGPRAKVADLWIALWVELNNLHAKETVIEVEHVKAHGIEKERQQMSLSEKFVTDGNEKADEFAKTGAMLDEGCVDQEREVCAALQPVFIGRWKNGKSLRRT